MGLNNKICMKKYRVEQYVSVLGNIMYGVDMRFLIIFWAPVKSFTNKEKAIAYCNILNEKLE